MISHTEKYRLEGYYFDVFFTFVNFKILFLKWTEKGQSHRDKKGPQLISSFFKTHFGTKFSKIEFRFSNRIRSEFFSVLFLCNTTAEAIIFLYKGIRNSKKDFS
jgi:hypothetical protein